MASEQPPAVKAKINTTNTSREYIEGIVMLCSFLLRCKDEELAEFLAEFKRIEKDIDDIYFCLYVVDESA